MPERACITTDALHKIDSGNLGVGVGNVAQLVWALGVLDQAVDAMNPLSSDFGRLRAGRLTEKRAQ